MKISQIKKGFTLVELLIVIVIVGVLSLALLPTIINGPKEARDAARLVNMNKIITAYYKYILIDGGTSPFDPNVVTQSDNADELLEEILTLFPSNHTAYNNVGLQFASVAYAGEVLDTQIEPATSTTSATTTTDLNATKTVDSTKDTTADLSGGTVTDLSSATAINMDGTSTVDLGGLDPVEGGLDPVGEGDICDVMPNDPSCILPILAEPEDEHPGSNDHFGLSPLILPAGADEASAYVILYSEVDLAKNGNMIASDINTLTSEPRGEFGGRNYANPVTFAESNSNNCLGIKMYINPEVGMLSSVEEGEGFDIDACVASCDGDYFCEQDCQTACENECSSCDIYWGCHSQCDDDYDFANPENTICHEGCDDLYPPCGECQNACSPY